MPPGAAADIKMAAHCMHALYMYAHMPAMAAKVLQMRREELASQQLAQMRIVYRPNVPDLGHFPRDSWNVSVVGAWCLRV